MENKKPIKRVLALCDFACATGFAQVSTNVIKQLLLDKNVDYQIDIVGINYHGLPNEWQNIAPQVRLFPALYISKGDVFGRQGYLNLLASGAYDLTWILQDTFQIEVIGQTILDIREQLAKANKKLFKWIFYFPIDAKPKENWITKSVALADIPVAYTQYGFDETVKFVPELKDRLLIVPHGIEEKVFYPIKERDKVAEFRKHYFLGKADDKFVIMNVNRNQPRKDVMRTMMIFKQFKEIVPNALLYLHMKANDVAYDLNEVARNFNLTPDEDYIVPQEFDENQGLDVAVLNYIYNAVDCVMTTTLGEGWGLSVTEAMATKTPIIAPNHTSLTEMIGEDRGTLVDAGKHTSDWVMLSMDNERLRPLVDAADFVDKLVGIRNNPELAIQKAENAYKFLIENWTWDIVGEKWREIFRDAGTIKQVVKLGRNDPCHCGSGKKYKNCHLNG